uniref:Ovule protein n=1 Tax=Echinococcus granulosus TaxID=6210 RepID=A0A068WRA7_ECHGR|nr:hypothetical protein EgrG_002027600 [Echinococcus granulosus]
MPSKGDTTRRVPLVDLQTCRLRGSQSRNQPPDTLVYWIQYLLPLLVHLHIVIILTNISSPTLLYRFVSSSPSVAF